MRPPAASRTDHVRLRRRAPSPGPAGACPFPAREGCGEPAGSRCAPRALFHGTPGNEGPSVSGLESGHQRMHHRLDQRMGLAPMRYSASRRRSFRGERVVAQRRAQLCQPFPRREGTGPRWGQGQVPCAAYKSRLSAHRVASYAPVSWQGRGWPATIRCPCLGRRSRRRCAAGRAGRRARSPRAAPSR